MEGQEQDKINIVWGYNELIAHYMGYKYFPFIPGEKPEDVKNNGYHGSAGWKVHKDVSGVSKLNAKEGDYLCRTVKGMAYHYDWNWLMPVVSELYIRHGYYVYLMGGVACSIYKEDLETPLSVANSTPKNFHIEYTAKTQEQLVMVMWQCVSETIHHILTNCDPKIPIIENYKGKMDWVKDINIDDLPTKEKGE